MIKYNLKFIFHYISIILSIIDYLYFNKMINFILIYFSHLIFELYHIYLRENSKYTPKTFCNSKNTPNFLQIPNIHPFSKKSSKYTPKRVKQIPDFEFLNSDSDDDADEDIPSTLPPNTRRPTGQPKNKSNRNSTKQDED